MRPLLRALAAAWATLLVAAADLQAQTVVGVVVEQQTLEPLPGVFVVLQSESSGARTATLAGADGRFRLRAPSAGRYRLVARRIGYADADAGVVSLEEGQTLERDIEIAVSAIRIESVEADAGERCQQRPGRDEQTGRLWQEARKALEITAWAEAEGVLRFQLVEHRRQLDAGTFRVRGMEEEVKRGYYRGSPYRSEPAEALEVAGYVQRKGDGTWDHFAPDAGVLLSESFLNAHCFRTRTGADPALIGLAFEPVLGNRLPEVEGVLWLDRATAELRRLEFTYVNLPYPHGSWPEVGGLVEFERVPGGAWIVRNWHIRMPLAAQRMGGTGPGAGELRLRTLAETGAVVSQIETSTGQVVAAVTATLFGTVRDSATGRPLTGATVEVVPTGKLATTDSTGAWRFTDLPSGTFGVTFSHPILDLLGSSHEASAVPDVRLRAGHPVQLDVRPLISKLSGDVCAAGHREPVLLHGTVRDSGGDPVRSGIVRIFGRGPERRVGVDTAGRYAACIERSDTVDLVFAEVGDIRWAVPDSHRLRVPIDVAALAQADLVVPRAPQAETAASSNRSQITLHGEVRGDRREPADRLPIAGAVVFLVRTDIADSPIHTALTDREGRFRFMLMEADQAPAQYRLTVVREGRRWWSQDMRLLSGEVYGMEVLLRDR